MVEKGQKNLRTCKNPSIDVIRQNWSIYTSWSPGDIRGDAMNQTQYQYTLIIRTLLRRAY
jgi:hypothetical protein